MQQWQCIQLGDPVEVAQQHRRRTPAVFRKQIQLLQHVVNTVRTKRDTYSRQSFEAEHACQVVIPPATANTAHRHLIGLYLEDTSSIVIEPSCEGDIELHHRV